jgi:putative ABC transport system substrate-binding protein
MKRREFITLLGGAAATWPLAARAQPSSKVWRIGFIFGSIPQGTVNLADGFRQGMRERGYSEGRDFIVEWRFAGGRYERFSEFAREFVQLKVDVIVLSTSVAVRPVQQSTTAIPIVMGYSIDPVGLGLVASLARPGGNTTGLASSLEDFVSKHLELLITAVPNLSRIGLLVNPNTPSHIPVVSSAVASSSTAGLEIVPEKARNLQEIEEGIVALSGKGVSALMVAPDPIFFALREKLAEFALRERLPTIFPQREYVTAGGLMSYGESLADFYRRAAVYVDKIFKGARPADLPIEQPTRFYLVINLRTAKALGLNIPETFLVRADEVIE